MSETFTTPRFSLPLLAVAQAQKEVTHNEALTLIDTLLGPVVEAGPMDAVADDPVVGQCWLVGDAATGAWMGHGDTIAVWTAGGWRFIAPQIDMTVWRQSDGVRLRYDGGAWGVPPSIAAPDGGSVVDLEARSAVNALLSALQSRGMLISG